MSRTLRIILCLLVVMCCFVGCSKPKDLFEAGVPQWELRTPNPLLNYVPDDAVFVLANLREPSQQNIVFNKLLKEIVDDMNFPEEFDVDALIEDYPNEAVKWGLDPNGNVDFASYIHGNNTLVIHFTVDNEKLALERINGLLKKSFLEAHDAGLLHYEFLENQGVHQQWQIHHIEINSGYSVNWAVHSFDNVVTFVMYKGTDLIPEYVLSAPKKPFSVDKLDDKTFLIAHVDHAGFAKYLLSWEKLENKLNDKYIRNYLSSDDEKRFKEKCEEQLEYCYPLEQYQTFADKVCDGDEWECRRLWYDYEDYDEIETDDIDKLPYCLDNREHEGEIIEREARKAHQEVLGKQIAEIKEKSDKIDVDTKLLRELGSTSIGDDVCMQEIASLFADSPSSDWAFVGSNSGLFGMRVTQAIANADLKQKLQKATSAYVDYYNPDVLLSVAMGMDLSQMYILSKDYWRDLSSRTWQCQQIAGFMEDIKGDMDKKIYGLESAIYQYILPVSLSGKLIYMDEGDFDNADFLGTVQFSSQDALLSMDKLLDHDLLGEDQDGSEYTRRVKGIDLKTLAVGENILFSSPNHILKEEDLSKRTKAHLLDVFVNRILLNELFKREVRKLNVSIPSYRMQADLNNNDLTFAILPVD